MDKPGSAEPIHTDPPGLGLWRHPVARLGREAAGAARSRFASAPGSSRRVTQRGKATKNHGACGCPGEAGAVTGSTWHGVLDDGMVGGAFGRPAGASPGRRRRGSGTVLVHGVFGNPGAMRVRRAGWDSGVPPGSEQLRGLLSLLCGTSLGTGRRGRRCPVGAGLACRRDRPGVEAVVARHPRPSALVHGVVVAAAGRDEPARAGAWQDFFCRQMKGMKGLVRAGCARVPTWPAEVAAGGDGSRTTPSSPSSAFPLLADPPRRTRPGAGTWPGCPRWRRTGGVV